MAKKDLSGLVDGNGEYSPYCNINQASHYFTVIKFCEERNGKHVQCMVCPKQQNGYRTMELRHLPLHIETAIHGRHVQRRLSGKMPKFLSNPNADRLDEPLAAQGHLSCDPSPCDLPLCDPPLCDPPPCDPPPCDLDASAFQINVDVAISGCSEECCMEDAPVPFSELWISDLGNREYKLDTSGDLFDIIQSMKSGTSRLFPDMSTPVNEEISDSSSDPGFSIEPLGK